MSKEKLPLVSNFKNCIQRQEIAKRMHYHRKKVKEAESKKSINSMIADEFSGEAYRTILDENPKKQYLLENKYTQIERENRLLFEKIAKISKHKKRQRSLERFKSLNISYRKKQIEEIQNQNVRMFNRILKQKPSISFKETDKDFMKTRKMSDRLSKKDKFRLQDWY